MIDSRRIPSAQPLTARLAEHVAATIREAVAAARDRAADLGVLPEMAVVGYCPRDLLFRRRCLGAADYRPPPATKRSTHILRRFLPDVDESAVP